MSIIALCVDCIRRAYRSSARVDRRLRELGYSDYDLETYEERYAVKWKYLTEQAHKLTRKGTPFYSSKVKLIYMKRFCRMDVALASVQNYDSSSQGEMAGAYALSNII